MLLATCFLVSPVFGQDIDPRGIYFNRFVGNFNGTEWFQVTPINGNQFNIRDIYGGGFVGTIDADGNVVIPGASMDGSFSGPDEFVIFPFNGQFTFSSNRVPTTTVDFPLILDSPRPANDLLAGAWNNSLSQINPETGVTLGTGTEVVTLTTVGNNITITDPGGLFFRGVFEDGLTAGFRVIANPSFPPATGIFATFPGSATSIGQDLLGEMNMISINEFRASFLLQSRTPLGNQTQTLFEFQATRVNPIAQGDANGDGTVNAVDESIVEFLQGSTFEDDNYNLAADTNNDGAINFEDLAFFCIQGDVNDDGAINLLDVAPFVAFIGAGFYTCEADVNIDGSVNLLDVAPFVDLLAGN